MKKSAVFLIYSLFVGGLYSQKLAISHSDIWVEGKFRQEGINAIRSMSDGENYTVLTSQGIEMHNYSATAEGTSTLLLQGEFVDYNFSQDEKQILLSLQSQPIYRRSKHEICKVYNRESKTYQMVFDGKPIQEPTFSPANDKLAFVYENDLYYQNIKTGEHVRLTHDGKKNSIINGITDWVYEEEFSFVRAFEWSTDGGQIAFVRFDESRVKNIHFETYLDTVNYPQTVSFKYPKAGEQNAKVSVYIIDLKSLDRKELRLGEYSDYYIPKLVFPAGKSDLFVLIANRHQNKVDVWKVDSQKIKAKLLFSEIDKAWIDTDNLTFEVIAQGIVWASERDGYRQLYLMDYVTGQLKKQLTKGNWEITKFYGADDQNVYYQSTQNGIINRGIYSASISKAKITPLATESGWNEAEFSTNYKYFINEWSDANTPLKVSLRETKTGKAYRSFEDNEALQKVLKEYQISPAIFFTVKNALGDELNAWMIQPENQQKDKRYPVLMYVYGGPGSQTVTNAWGGSNYLWFQQLAQQGYIVVSVDGRGTGGRGSDFKKATYLQLGKHEISDQIYAARYLQTLPYVDPDRIGMFGWSYGGYMTSLAMTKGAEVFKTGIAVAPVTNWRFYDSVYTERYMQTPQENAEGYDSNSPVNHVEKLKGKYLLIHGTADDNVHYQNTMIMSEALVQADKEFDMHSYTDKNHGIYGGYTRLHLYRKMTNYLLENL